jgi:LysR substrate binding domain
MSASSVPSRNIPTASVIKQERLLLALPADHRLADEVEMVEVRVLSDETLIVRQFDEDNGLMDYAAEFVAAVRPTPEHVYPVRGIPTALSLVGAGVGVALVSESWRSLAMANVVYREIVDFERKAIMVLAHRTGESAPAVLAFVETAKDCRPEREGRPRVDTPRLLANQRMTGIGASCRPSAGCPHRRVAFPTRVRDTRTIASRRERGELGHWEGPSAAERCLNALDRGRTEPPHQQRGIS